MESQSWTRLNDYHLSGVHHSIIHSNYLLKDLWRRKWQPTPVLLPGKSHGRRSLVGCSPWDCKESDTTERLHFLSFFHSVKTLFPPPRSITPAHTRVHTPTPILTHLHTQWAALKPLLWNLLYRHAVLPAFPVGSKLLRRYDSEEGDSRTIEK